MDETAISKELVAICMMGGVVIWVEKERADKLDALFLRPRSEWPQFIDIEGEKVNPSRVEGIFSAAAMEDAQRRKNGQWLCKEGTWHDRFEKCACAVKEVRELRGKLARARAGCGECDGSGYIRTERGVAECRCSHAILAELRVLS